MKLNLERNMFRHALIAIALVGLVGCQSAEGKRREAAFIKACIEDQNQGACNVLAAHGISRAQAQRNWITATNNTANWAVQQQNTRTYSGGGRGSVCSVNSLTGQRFCY